MMVSRVASKERQYAMFRDFFPTGASISEPYQNCYILLPISIEAKFKQLSVHIRNPEEPIYSLSLDIDDF